MAPYIITSQLPVNMMITPISQTPQFSRKIVDFSNPCDIFFSKSPVCKMLCEAAEGHRVQYDSFFVFSP